MKIKEVRGQLRQITKEVLPEVLNEAYYADLKKHVDARLNAIEAHIKHTLKQLEEKQKDAINFVVRNVK